MSTKVQQKTTPNPISLPAGLIFGKEGIWHNNEKWVIIDGTTSRFVEAPTKVQNLFVSLFMKDTRSRNYLKKEMKITEFQQAFDTWFKCVLGGLDSTPDISADEKLVPDSYNNMCQDYTCPHRGKLCSVRTGLKNYEVETILVLESGKTFEQAADALFLSLPGLKSRVEKIKEKLGAVNVANMVAIAAKRGII